MSRLKAFTTYSRNAATTLLAHFPDRPDLTIEGTPDPVTHDTKFRITFDAEDGLIDAFVGEYGAGAHREYEHAARRVMDEIRHAKATAPPLNGVQSRHAAQIAAESREAQQIAETQARLARERAQRRRTPQTFEEQYSAYRNRDETPFGNRDENGEGR